MVFQALKIKSFFFVGIVVFLVFSFPLQILSGNPYPSLLPYILMLGFGFFSLGKRQNGSLNSLVRFDRVSNIDRAVLLYVFIVVAHSIGHAAFLPGSLGEISSSVVIFLFPVFFYWCFRRENSSKVMKYIFITIALLGLIVGLHFIYDTYLKVVIGEVSQYTRKAFEYTLSRHGVSEWDPDINKYQITVNARSFGLLETHSVSGAWIVIGLIGALASIPKRMRKLYGAAKLLYGTMLLISMNFTNFLAFFIILIFVYGKGLSSIKSILVFRQKSYMIVFLSLFIVIFFICMSDSRLVSFVQNSVFDHFTLLLGTGNREYGFLDLVGAHVVTYLDYWGNNPGLFLFGDGFSSFGVNKGGDVGWLDTIARFGLLIFIILFISFINLIKVGITIIQKEKRFQRNNEGDGRLYIVEFSTAIIMLIFINDGHYSIWFAKSVLPIFFIALGLLNSVINKKPVEEQSAVISTDYQREGNLT